MQWALLGGMCGQLAACFCVPKAVTTSSKLLLMRSAADDNGCLMTRVPSTPTPPPSSIPPSARLLPASNHSPPSRPCVLFLLALRHCFHMTLPSPGMSDEQPWIKTLIAGLEFAS